MRELSSTYLLQSSTDFYVAGNYLVCHLPLGFIPSASEIREV